MPASPQRQTVLVPDDRADRLREGLDAPTEAEAAAHVRKGRGKWVVDRATTALPTDLEGGNTNREGRNQKRERHVR